MRYKYVMKAADWNQSSELTCYPNGVCIYESQYNGMESSSGNESMGVYVLKDNKIFAKLLDYHKSTMGESDEYFTPYGIRSVEYKVLSPTVISLSGTEMTLVK